MQPLELVARVAHVAAHGRVGPGAVGVSEEPQVQLDQARHGRDRVVVEAQLAQTSARELRAHHVVMVERHGTARLEPSGGGLADVVQQRGEPHDEIGRFQPAARHLVIDRLVEHGERVLVHVFVVVVFVDLEPQRRDLGQHPIGEAGIHQQTDAAPRRRGQQQLRQLIAHALGRDAVDLGGQPGHRLAGLVLDLEPELRREPGGAEHPQRIIAERALGRRRSAQGLREQVLDTTRGIDEGELRQPQGKRVHREVPADQVVFEARPEHHLGLAGVAVVGICAVRRDLHRLARDAGADRAEVAADVPVRIGDRFHDREDLVGRGIRREIEVVRVATEEGVAHRAAHEGELVPRCLERLPESRDGRRSGQLAQPVEGRRDTLHAPMLFGASSHPVPERGRWTDAG